MCNIKCIYKKKDINSRALELKHFYEEVKIISYYFPTLENAEYKIKTTKESLYSMTSRECFNYLCENINILFPSPLKLTLIDGTANIGSDTIKLCNRYKGRLNKIYSIELKKDNFLALKHNIDLYKLITENMCECYNMSSLIFLDTSVNVDIIYIDPPWGGENYKDIKNLNLSLDNINIIDIYIKYIDKSKLFIFKLPITYNYNYFNDKIFEYNKEQEYKIVCEKKEFISNNKRHICDFIFLYKRINFFI